MANDRSHIARLGDDYSKRPMQVGSPVGHHEVVDGSGASATSAETFYGGQLLRLVAIGNVGYFVFGTGPADATDIYLSPDIPEYFSVRDDTKVTVFGAEVDITVMR